MTKYQKDFIRKVAGIVDKYAPSYSIKCAEAVTAQAALESNWGRSALAIEHNNFFGMKAGLHWKGKTVTYSTKEVIKGQTKVVKATFRSYKNVDEGIRGYFEFISSPRYSNLKKAETIADYALMLHKDGYATDPNYTTKLVQIAKLIKGKPENKTPALEVIANDIKKGVYGTSEKEQKNRLYNTVQSHVNAIMSGRANEDTPLDILAQDVIKGVYGNGAKRKEAIYATVMQKVKR